MAHLGCLRCPTLLPTSLVLRSYCSSRKVLGHVQLYFLVNHHYRYRCRSQFYWPCHLSTLAWRLRSNDLAVFCLHHSNVVQSTVSLLDRLMIMDLISREQSYRTIAYQVANSFAAIVGPLMSWGIGQAGNGSIHAYQGIFLFIGSFSLAFTPLVWYLMPNSPTTAKFLRKGDDRLIALERLRENNTGTKSSEWKWSQVRETYRDPKTYMWAAMYL